MVEQMIEAAKPKMEATLDHFKEELKTIRTGRASVHMLDSIVVSYYGTPTPLKALATLSTPEATQIVIQPFDASAVRDIASAIRDSDLGFNPTDDGRMVRVSIPPLTSDRREEMVKMVGKMSEEARISVRQNRAKVWEDIQKAQRDAVITEDNRDFGRDKIDDLTAEYNKKIEELVKEKEVEVRTV